MFRVARPAQDICFYDVSPTQGEEIYIFIRIALHGAVVQWCGEESKIEVRFGLALACG